MDNLIICKRCGSDACLENIVSDDIRTYHCMGCGFISNTFMVENNEFYEQQIQTLPEIYKDLMYQDDENKWWFPSTINLQEQGMVFVEGTSKNKWKWASVKAVKRTEEDKKKNPKVKSDWKMDMSNIKYFEERDYMEALSYISVLPQ